MNRATKIVRDLLVHAIYDREKSDECIAAVEAAEAFLADYEPSARFLNVAELMTDLNS